MEAFKGLPKGSLMGSTRQINEGVVDSLPATVTLRHIDEVVAIVEALLIQGLLEVVLGHAAGDVAQHQCLFL